MDNLRGIAWMTLAMLAFALEDMFIKLVAEIVPPGQTIFVIGGIGATVFATAARARGYPLLAPLRNRAFQARMGVETAVTVCFISALTLTPISSVSAIIQSTPLIVTLGAALFLGARVGPRRWTAIAIGMCGVLLIIRPGAADFDPASLLSVLAAIGLATRDVITRVVPRTIPTLVLATWGFAATLPAGVILMAVMATPPVVPQPLMLLALAAAALVALLAYFSITAAMRVGEIAVVTPFRYTRLVFAMIIAYAVFEERPDALTYLGAAIVIATGLFTLWRETQAMRQPFPRPPISG